MSRAVSNWVGVALGLAVVWGCKKQAPPVAKVAASAARAAPSASAAPVASLSQPSREAAKPTPPPAPSAPAPLDEAGVRTARGYVTALGRGRKATAARDFTQAEEQFSKCLELVPGDPRALAERGYARLLAEKVDEAEADLVLAEKAAPSATLLLQVLHNRMLVAKKRGDDKEAARFERAKRELKAARRLDHGVSCSFEDGSGSLVAQPVASLDAALRLFIDSHAKAAEGDPAHVTFSDYSADDTTDVKLRGMLVDGKLPDGGWTLTTGNDDYSTVANHALFARAGKLFALPVISVGTQSRCSLDGLATVRVGHGAGPWHIYREQEWIYPAYMCEFDDHSYAPCGTVEGKGEGTPVQTYCAWASTDVELHLLDPSSFNGIRRLAVSAQAGEATTPEPLHLLDYEWQPTQVSVTACGTPRLVPYASQ